MQDITIHDNCKSIEDLLVNSSPFIVNDISEHNLYNLAFIPVKHIRLIRKSWIFEKGKRINRDYLLGEKLCVRHSYYDYQFHSSGDGRVVSFKQSFRYYLHDGVTVGMDVNIPMDLNIDFLYEVNKNIRKQKIDYLLSHGRNLRHQADTDTNLSQVEKTQLIQFADLIDSMFDKYKVEVERFERLNSGDLLSVINAETDPAIVAGLNTPNPYEQGKTMKDIIVDQLTNEVNPPS